MDVHITRAVHIEIERLLRARFGDVSIERAELLRLADAVWRVMLSQEPHSVIVKVRRTNEGDPRAGEGVLAQEERSLRFLHSTGLVPAVLTSDPGMIVILEDLGDRSLSTSLTETDASAAEHGLVAYASALGRLHAATPDPGAYERATSAPPPMPSYPGSWLEATTIAEQWASTRDGATGLGSPEPPSAANDEIASIISALAEPGAWLAFSGGDPCPGNVIVTSDGCAADRFRGGELPARIARCCFVAFPVRVVHAVGTDPR